MPVSKNHLPQTLLKELFDYDPLDGRLIWKVKLSNNAPIGAVAGTGQKQNGRGGSGKYIVVGIGGRSYLVHILIWIWMTGYPPTAEIDHENRNGVDNRWINLREATRSQNQTNTDIYKNNKCGYRGVHRHQGRFRAMISIDGKNKHIGYFDYEDEAAAAWLSESQRHRGDFAQRKCVAAPS